MRWRGQVAGGEHRQAAAATGAAAAPVPAAPRLPVPNGHSEMSSSRWLTSTGGESAAAATCSRRRACSWGRAAAAALRVRGRKAFEMLAGRAGRTLSDTHCADILWLLTAPSCFLPVQ